ncbi:MAG: YkvA family protein [Candidatus Velamenicoccus archaeovorus]
MRALLIALGCLLAVWAIAVAVLVVVGRRSQARELITLLPNLLLLFRGLIRDRRVPRSSRLWLWFAVIWVASPIDLVPEFVPVAGPLDDALVAALVLRHVLRRTDRAVLMEHWRGDPATLDAIVGKPATSDPSPR